jgi:hypothetical protein
MVDVDKRKQIGSGKMIKVNEGQFLEAVMLTGVPALQIQDLARTSPARYFCLDRI